jgi:hypothetical protein
MVLSIENTVFCINSSAGSEIIVLYSILPESVFTDKKKFC